MRFPVITLLTSFASLALGDVLFTSPAAGATFAGGSTLSIVFKESGTSPAISTLASYQLFLMAGGNDDTNMQQLQTLVATGTFSTLTASAIIQAGVGGSTANAYFLKMISVSKEGGQVINFSSRFTLTGMTGTFSTTVQQGITAVGSDTAGPAAINQVANNAAGTTEAAAGAAQFTVPYQLQTGLTKYAPMQPVPGTKITATAYTPLHPTSAYTLATTYMGTPIVATTLTMSQTFSVSSMENTVAAASAPTGDMAKFLARWKD